jgi:Tfp pilus assembly protein PilX
MQKKILDNRAQTLVGAALLMLVLLIMVPAVVQWVRQEALMSVKDQKNTTAFNLAQAAVQRGYWKAKSSTGTIALALAGQSLLGYEFDSTYNDIVGGTYRIHISSASNSSIMITGEGRDTSTNQVRAISATYQNRTIYSPLLAQGNVSYGKGMCIYWGAIMSQGNITLDNTTAQWYFPLKYAKADVIGTLGNPRNTTWPLPPDTDNIEWWSNDADVPELPILDFVTLRSSAAATHTLNVYGCRQGHTYTDPNTGATDSGRAPWTNSVCVASPPHYSGSGGACYGSSCHFSNPWNHPKSAQFSPNTDYVWYWDGDVTLAGKYCGNSPCGESNGLRGTMIVRGNLTIDTPGEYFFTGHVPSDAWKNQVKLWMAPNSPPAQWDTSAQQEYPADIGLNQNSATFNFGSTQWCQPGQNCGWISTPGFRGFIYVGGNLIIQNFMDVIGAVWVNGTVAASCPRSDPNCRRSFCGIFYNDQLAVPTLNVILIKTAWQETQPSSQSWAP